MFTKNEIKAELLRQLSVEYNCTPEDFAREENVITTACDRPERRKYTPTVPAFSMVTLGGNAVISADERLHGWLREYAADKKGIWLFEYQHLSKIENELVKYGFRICQTSHMFLPEPEFCNLEPADFQIQWYEQAEIMQFYGDDRFPNAICDRFRPERPDVLAVCAVIDGEIAGMAGCSADTPAMWQIGIDVSPRYRGRKIGTTLVALLKNEVFRRGAIPFYGTSLSNLHSWNIAIHCGFTPSWVELYLTSDTNSSHT